MASPCLTTAPTPDDPLVIHAKAGLIKLKVAGAVFFDPAQTDVVTTAGCKVAFTCAAQTLSFTGVSGTSYFLEILHGGSTDNAEGQLQEDCAAAVTLATLSPASTFSRYQIDVA